MTDAWAFAIACATVATAFLSWAFAWWDIQRKTIERDTARETASNYNETQFSTLRMELDRRVNEAVAKLVDEKSALASLVDDNAGLCATAFKTQGDRLTALESAMRDMGNPKPAREAKAQLSPFGERK